PFLRARYPTLIALAKNEPGKITYATAGIGSGSHLSTELFAAMTGVKFTHVPYRGTGAAQADLIAGHVGMMITTLPSVISAIRGGLLRAVAVTGASRSPLFPELLTIAESGVPGYVAVIHYGMVAPAGTDGVITGRLNAALRDALANEEVRARIADEGGEPLPGPPDRQASDIDEEETKWSALVRKFGLTVERGTAMQRSKPPFRADHVGSLLRPAALKQARAKRELGEISEGELARIEDREIEKVIRKQEGIGLKAVTDGEFRRA